jgi:UDP-N-acetylmuramate dehydrogenase
VTCLQNVLLYLCIMPETKSPSILENVSLKGKNSFGVDARTSYYVAVSSEEQLHVLLKEKKIRNHPVFILGEGSNILFTSNFEGMIIHPAMKGIKIISEDRKSCVISVPAGENWDDFVNFCVRNQYYGIENLSLIPGSAGAAPIQNIGAYGMEACETIQQVKGIDLISAKKMSFSNHDCDFAYRDSVFKRELKNRFLITEVIFKLSKKPVFRLDYGNLREEVNKLGELHIQNLRQAVINIRKSKLPDPAKTGNAGSFFKNPVVSIDVYEKIKKEHPDVPGFFLSASNLKIPAGWLIEKCGWKGRRLGHAGVHDKQALIIVNHGNASGKEIFDLSEKILRSVQERFGIILEREVNLV